MLARMILRGVILRTSKLLLVCAAVVVAVLSRHLNGRSNHIFKVRFFDTDGKARQTLHLEIRRNIGKRIEVMRDDLRGDVLKLRDRGNRYRLRIGMYRVLFVLAGDVVQVYAVKDRKKA